MCGRSVCACMACLLGQAFAPPPTLVCIVGGACVQVVCGAACVQAEQVQAARALAPPQLRVTPLLLLWLLTREGDTVSAEGFIRPWID